MPALFDSLAAITRARDFAKTFALDLAEAHRQSFVQRMRDRYGYRVPVRREEWLPYDLAELIADYVQALEKLRQQVLQAEWIGEESKKLVPDQPLLPQIENITARYGADLSRRIYARLEHRRQQTEGVTHYIWGTEGDDRVRDSHAANEGHIFAWDNPPATGHPGDASNCRCSASPVKLPDDPPIEPVYPIESIILGGLARAIFKRMVEEILRRAKEPAKPAEKPVPKKPETPKEILNPNGRPIGKKGNGSKVRVVEGGDKAAQDLFKRLSKNGKPETPPGYPGKGTKLPNGDWVGYRPKSKSGPPAVDVKVKDVNFKRIHFP